MHTTTQTRSHHSLNDTDLRQPTTLIGAEPQPTALVIPDQLPLYRNAGWPRLGAVRPYHRARRANQIGWRNAIVAKTSGRLTRNSISVRIGSP